MVGRVKILFNVTTPGLQTDFPPMPVMGKPWALAVKGADLRSMANECSKRSKTTETSPYCFLWVLLHRHLFLKA